MEKKEIITPKKVENLPPIQSVAVGHNMTFLLDKQGLVWASGTNYTGQLGLGDTKPRTRFEKISSLSGIVEIYCQFQSVVFLDSAGTVWLCEFQKIPYKMELPDLPPIKTVASGSNCVLMVDFEGSVWVKGGYMFSIPNGKMLHPTNILQVACGANFAMLLDATGDVWGIGANSNGIPSADSLVKIKTVSNIQSISCGIYHTLLLDFEGNVWGCGITQFGETPPGTEEGPQKFENLPPIVSISAGGCFSVLVDEEGLVWACGINNYGQLGLGNKLHQRTCVQNTLLPPISLPSMRSTTKNARNI